jgi:predicted acylesterase/phospholipase RssA
VFGDGWPSDALWIPAVRLRDGKLAVFGHPSTFATDVGTAVASSSAVPGVWQPQAAGIGHERDAYVDGGIASTAHVHLAADMPEITVAMLSSPLSRMPGVRSMLRGELRIAHRQGLDVIRFEPGPDTVTAMGWNPMNRARALEVASVAYQETLGRLAPPSA